MKLKVKNNFVTLLDRHGNAIQPRGSSEPYSGAEISRLLNDLPDCDYTQFSTVSMNAERLRARARHLERNNDIVRRCLYLVEQNVIGPGGVKLVPRVTRTNNGRVEQEATNRLIAAEWDKFTRSSDIRRRYQSFRQACKLVNRRRIVDGEIFIELLPGFGNETKFSFRLLEPYMVPMGLSDESRRISMGIEYDKDWIPVAYFVRDKAGDETFKTEAQHKYRRVPAERILHYFSPERPHQGRGITLLASPIQRLHMLDKYEEATLTGARIASSKMGFFYDDLDDDMPVPYGGSETDNTADIIDPETGRPIDGDNFIDIEAGQFEDIGTKRFTPFDPGYPPTGYDEYTTSILRSISAGLNIPYHMLAGDLRNVNYSTAREAKLDAVDAWQDLQSQFRDAVLDPMLEEWMKIQTLRPEFRSFSSEDLPRLLKHRWQFRGWKWIDPQKEAKGAENEMRMTTKAPSQIVQERGENYEEVVDQIAKDLEYAKSRGIDIMPFLYGSNEPTPNTETV